MSGRKADIARAEAEAAAARQRIVETLARLKMRVDPRVRARETWEGVREKSVTLGDDALEFGYERPSVVAGIVGIGVLFVLRRPIARLFRWLGSGHRPKKWDARGLPGNPAPPPKRLPGKGGERR